MASDGTIMGRLARHRTIDVPHNLSPVSCCAAISECVLRSRVHQLLSVRGSYLAVRCAARSRTRRSADVGAGFAMSARGDGVA